MKGSIVLSNICDNVFSDEEELIIRELENEDLGVLFSDGFSSGVHAICDKFGCDEDSAFRVASYLYVRG